MSCSLRLRVLCSAFCCTLNTPALMRVSQPSQSDGLAVSVDADGRLLRWDRTLQSAHLMTTGSDTAVPDRVTSLCVLRNDDVAIGGWSGAVYIVSHCPTRVKQVTPQKHTHTGDSNAQRHIQRSLAHKHAYHMFFTARALIPLHLLARTGHPRRVGLPRRRRAVGVFRQHLARRLYRSAGHYLGCRRSSHGQARVYAWRQRR